MTFTIILFALVSSPGIFQGERRLAYASAPFETVKHRDLTIDLGNGLSTRAQLTLPIITRNASHPAVLLVHGSGATDMDVTISPDIKPFSQLSQYLSERGFVVLRYDKRGIGPNGTISDPNVWGNITFADLKNDAEKALETLRQQPEVNPREITLIGHSEGSMIVPRIVLDVNNNSTSSIKNIILMGAVAQNLHDILRFQILDYPLQYANEVLDKDHTGSFSLNDGLNDPFLGGLVKQVFANSTSEIILIDSELRPILEQYLRIINNTDSGTGCSMAGCPDWIRSHEELEPTVELFGNLSSVRVLILNGEADSQTVVQQAFLLEQKLVASGHPDHRLIIYPGLGHLFSPSSKWYTELGPIDPVVLSDLYEWTSSHRHDPTHGSNGC